MKYEDDEFEKNVTERTDEVSGISDIDDLLQTTDKVTTDKVWSFFIGSKARRFLYVLGKYRKQ